MRDESAVEGDVMIRLAKTMPEMAVREEDRVSRATDK
jgi:hypothetical protein